MCAISPQEVGVLKGLNYDRNIVQFYGACIQDGSDPMLVTEFMEGAHGTPVLCGPKPAQWDLAWLGGSSRPKTS